MKNKWLDRSILELGYYTLCTNEKQYRREVRRLGIPENRAPDFLNTPQANASVDHFERDGKQCYIVCLGSSPEVSDEQVIALLVHEAVHRWQEFCDFIGETSPGRETEAYAIQRISQSLVYEYRRQMHKPAKKKKGARDGLL